MKLFPTEHTLQQEVELMKHTSVALREQARRKQIVSAVLLVIVIFQFAELPGALLMHTAMDIGTVVLGLALCAVAALFNQFGKVTIVTVLLIAVIDLGCGLMLLTSPMGLNVSDLPVFDVLLVSELIAVSLLPAISVFPVALGNMLFTIVVLMFAPRTMELNMVLNSNMAYNTILQPLGLQLIVAVVSYIWVRSALRALARADRAEEISQLQRREAELLRREAEFNHSLTQGSEHLLQVLVRAANGDQGVRSALTQDHPLWRIGNALNVLLTRVGRMANAEQEIKRLRMTIAQLTERVFDRERGHRPTQPPARPVTPLSQPVTPPAMPSSPNARPIRQTTLLRD
jgi:cell division protein FtsB